MHIPLHVVPVAFGAAAAAVLLRLGRRRSAAVAAVVAAGATLVTFRLLPFVHFSTRRHKNSDGTQSKPRPFHVGITRLTSENFPTPVVVYYPTFVAPSRGAWAPYMPDMRVAFGVARYGQMPSLLFNHLSLVTADVVVGAPMAPRLASQKCRHVVIFSHGLGACAELYTALLMELAALGIIAISIQHLDGSSGFAVDRSGNEVPMGSRSHPGHLDDEELVEREQQLRQRVDEMVAVVKDVCSLTLLEHLGVGPDELKGGQFSVAIAGHSFGGSTAAATLLRCTEIGLASVRGAVCLDMWGFPLRRWFLPRIRQLPSPLPPMLLLESEEWATEHAEWGNNAAFEEEMLLCANVRGSRRVAKRTDHMTICDVGPLSPVVSRKKCADTTKDLQVIAETAETISKVVGDWSIAFQQV